MRSPINALRYRYSVCRNDCGEPGYRPETRTLWRFYMLFRTLALIALFGFSFSSNAYADVASCIQNAERDKDAIMCAYRSFLDSDNTLNEVYQATLQGNRLDEQTKQYLRTAQLSWIEYKENFCDAKARAFTAERNLSVLELYACLQELTEEQTQKLRSLYR